MKKINKKGFTIVELVIVIAVIAILAAVMIPTFSNVVTKAQESAAIQEARNKYTELMAEDLSDGKLDAQGGKFNDVKPTTTPFEYTPSNDATVITKFQMKCSNGKTVTFQNNTWTAE